MEAAWTSETLISYHTASQPRRPPRETLRLIRKYPGENLVLRERNYQEEGENYIMMNFIICTLLLMLRDQIAVMRRRGHVASMRQMINSY
jgi:hypothetical protein